MLHYGTREQCNYGGQAMFVFSSGLCLCIWLLYQSHQHVSAVGLLKQLFCSSDVNFLKISKLCVFMKILQLHISKVNYLLTALRKEEEVGSANLPSFVCPLAQFSNASPNVQSGFYNGMQRGRGVEVFHQTCTYIVSFMLMYSAKSQIQGIKNVYIHNKKIVKIIVCQLTLLSRRTLINEGMVNNCPYDTTVSDL